MCVHRIPKTELNEQATLFQNKVEGFVKVQARREGGTTGALAPSTGAYSVIKNVICYIFQMRNFLLNTIN